MKKLETEYLLRKLKEKADSLSRTPTKEEIDADKNMPHSSTYYARFGGITEACKLLDLPVTRLANLTLEKAIEMAQLFYKTYGRAPMVSDFDNLPNYPHSSYIRKDLNLTWNQFLLLADLPVLTNGEHWVKNLKAERIVEKFLKDAQIRYEHLSIENTNAPNSFILWDNIRIDVRYSSPIIDQKREFWKFRLHLKDKKILPDYCVCVGFNEFNQFVRMFLIPINELKEKQDVVSINIRNFQRSKYAKYEVQNLKADMFK